LAGAGRAGLLLLEFTLPATIAHGRAMGKKPLISARRGERIQPGIYSHNNPRVIAVLDLKCMHPRRVDPS
jgi:hypothetical protein